MTLTLDFDLTLDFNLTLDFDLTLDSYLALNFDLTLDFDLNFAKYGCKKICKIFASKLGSESGVMSGFQKGITLGSRTSGSVLKVYGGWVGGWWSSDNRVSKVQVLDSRLKTSDFGLDFWTKLWTWTLA